MPHFEAQDTYEVVTVYLNADDPQCDWGHRFFRERWFVLAWS